jgi:hypothetical protein
MDVDDALDLIGREFHQALWQMADAHRADLERGLESKDDLIQLGRGAAAAALAPMLWAAAVGETWNTSRTAGFLKVSRQALYKRIRSGTILALPGQGTSEFPVWQFDPETRLVRHVVSGIVQVFRTADDQVSPLVIAGWANAPNERLDQMTPAQWIAADRDEEAVLTAARRAAQGLAS